MPQEISPDELKNNIMKSTIRIKQDWEKNEPYIQLKLDTSNPNEEVDLADSALIHFVQRANNLGLELLYQNGNEDNRSPQIRLMVEQPRMLGGVKIKYHSELFRNWLTTQGVSWNSGENYTLVFDDVNLFELGQSWQCYIANFNEIKE